MMENKDRTSTKVLLRSVEGGLELSHEGQLRVLKDLLEAEASGFIPSSARPNNPYPMASPHIKASSVPMSDTKGYEERRYIVSFPLLVVGTKAEVAKQVSRWLSEMRVPRGSESLLRVEVDE